MNIRDEIAHMIRMEHAAEYMEKHIRERITQEEVAKADGVRMNTAYFGKMFTQYYDVSFREYFVMMRMRDAARLIRRTHNYRNVGKLYGYSDVKSFRESFEKEIGCSPREFAGGWYRVPDMPGRRQLAGVPLSFSYAELRDIVLYGVHLSAPEGKQFDRLNDAGYALSCRPDWEDRLPGKSRLFGGVWTINQEGRETYFIGEANRSPVTAISRCQPVRQDEDGSFVYVEENEWMGMGSGVDHRSDLMIKGKDGSPMDRVEIDGGHYAVFIAQRGEDEEKNVLIARMIARYAFFEWRTFNRKETNHMGFTFEMFDKDHLYLFVPLMGRYGSDSRFRENMQVAEFRHYIDKHIKEEIDIKRYAEGIYYSDRWLRDSFQRVYHISPQRYIDDKRMRLVMSRIQEGYEGKKAELVAEYQYATMPAFSRKFQNHFGMPWQEYIKIESKKESHYLDPLYIEGDPDREIQITIDYIPDITLDVHALYMEGTRMERYDYPGLVTYWFTHSYDIDYFGFPLQNTRLEEKYFIYGIGRSPGQDLEDPRYVIGAKADKEKESPKGYKKRKIKGGQYICFSLKNPEAIPNKLDQYQQIESTIFVDWYQDNELIIDTTKEKLIRYQNGQLIFCLPMDI